MVCLQEIKLSHISDRDVAYCLGPEFINFVFLPAQQTRGGILIAWREGSLEVSFCVAQQQGGPGLVVHGCVWPHRDNEKIAFLDELGEVRAACPSPWKLAGGFNI